MRILIVEDESKIAGSLQRGLVAEGYVVDVAPDSDIAELLMDTAGYDLVLLDWMIPGTYDGPNLLARWRETRKHAPVLMLTARTSIGDRVRGLDSGADDYLTKPFSFDELLARVRALLRRPAEHSGITYRLGDVELDTVSKTVRRAGQPLHLTTKEFKLLEYLATHPGEVISKDRLLDHLWADEERVQHNTVETFVANLRKKIDVNRRSSIIRTVRGFGYSVTP